MSVFSFSDLAFMGAVGGVAAFDPDAQAYITAVETADGQALETAVKDAINAFVVGCKADGIWTAIKASCILAGARTLAGALVPLVGAAPTNYNFVAVDYDRKTGLVGNGSTKYLDSNRSNNADFQNSKHVSCFVTEAQSVPSVFIGTASSLNVPGDCYMYTMTSRTTARLHSSGTTQPVDISVAVGPGLAGLSRSGAGSFAVLFNGQNYVSAADSSQPPINENIHIFKGGNQRSNARIAFYSIGESLDLALLDGRVTALINAFAAAIP